MITDGISDWQVIQQDRDGFADIRVQGTFHGPSASRPQCRLVDEATGRLVVPPDGWHDAMVAGDRWTVTLRVPAGGPYRFETRLAARQLDLVGDMRHHVGVGDVWVIAGQSNAAGYGRGSVTDPPAVGVSVFAPAGRWRLASHPLNDHTKTRYPLSRDAGRVGVSPWLAFAKALRRELGVPIGLIPTALGGSPIRRWDPAQEGDLFGNMLAMVRDAGCTTVRGMLWYQGESDASPELAAAYRAAFVRLIDAAREAVGRDDFVTLTVQLNRVTDANAGPARARGWAMIREIQREIAAERPDVGVIPALDLTLSDVIHIDAPSSVVLGERMAQLALGLAYGRAGVWRPPEVDRAAFADGERQTIELHVAHVVDGLVPLQPRGAFVVVDARGEVPIGEVTLVAPDRIRLRLTRPAEGRVVCHGAYGDDPPVGFVDGRKLPILGFLGHPVAEPAAG
ncbi:MAG TPA: sialate O-acetylesterase [Limnochordia bacterium]